MTLKSCNFLPIFELIGAPVFFPRSSLVTKPKKLVPHVVTARDRFHAIRLSVYKYCSGFGLVALLYTPPLHRSSVKADLPPVLDSTSEPPPVFDGTTRLYISYTCPYAQRVWSARNYKGLQDKIKLVPIDLANRPTWYKGKVYPENKVPSLEHNNKVIGESLDLLQYLEDNFEGPTLLPNDPAKRQFAEELLSYTATFTRTAFTSLKGNPVKETGSAFDHIETALHKFNDGHFFLGQFSLVDIAFAPFIGSFQPVLQDVWNYDITAGRPKLAAWVEEMNKIDAYTQTKTDPEEIVAQFKKRFPAQ